MPLEPASRKTVPKVPLWPFAGLAGRSSPQSPCSYSQVLISADSTDASGMPISATATLPARPRPGWNARPRFHCANVTVREAWTQGPGAAPVSAFSPDGRSTERTGTPDPFIQAMASAIEPCVAPLIPVPSKASMIRSNRPPSRQSSPVPADRIAGPSFSSAARAVRASPRTSSRPPNRTGRASNPISESRLAATNPSPPLFPLPQHTSTRRPPEAASISAASAATAAPAFSMSVVPGIPACSMA